MMRALFVFLAGTCLAGCGRSERPAANCKWPEDTASALNLRNRADRQHLNDDALRAEDLAIRYADSVNAPHSGHFQGFAAYTRTTQTCMATLFDMVARNHRVSANAVRESLGYRRAGPDAAIMLFFAALYGLVAYALSRRVCRNFPLDGGSDVAAALVATVMTSMLVSLLAVMIGEWYAITVEMIRVGNGHLSYRTNRVPWTQHRIALFLAGSVSFWLIAGLRYRTEGRRPVAPSGLYSPRQAR